MIASNSRPNLRTSATAIALGAAAIVSVCGLAHGATAAAAGQLDAQQLLKSIYRGVGIHEDQGRPRIIYGVPMGGGLSPRASSESWLTNFAGALGGGGSTFAEAWSATFPDGNRTVYCYQQFIGGLPVEYGIAKILVQHGPTNAVVYAAGTLASAPDLGFPAMLVEGATAMAIVGAMEPYQKLAQWTKPELVVYQGEGDWIAPVRAWKFLGQSANIADKMCKTFFVDAATGRLAAVRDEVLYIDVNGTVKGKATPGLLPDTASNPAVLANMPELKVGISGGNTAYSDRSGVFSIVHGGSSPVTLNSGLGTASGFGGRWSSVTPAQNASQAGVTPPGPGALIFNNAPAAATTAQVNAFIATTAIHNYFRDRSGTFGLIDIAITTNTGVSGTCNAFYQNSTINFYNAGGGCVNSAYSTVVAHEYGHYIVSKLGGGSGLPQNAFGEGFGDTCAMLSYDTNIIAQDFYGPGTQIRNPLAANQQYPCGGAIHTCGQVLGGVWWDIRTNMGSFYGSGPGLTKTQQLHVLWALITTGGPNSSNSAGPGTAIEVLTVDDDDANLANGTPNLARICPAFAGHGISCTGPTIPANNACSGAIPISNGVTPFSNVNATTTGPSESNCSFCCGDLQVNQDLWYDYTAPCTGTATVSLCGSTFDTKVAVYGSCPTGPDSAIACNDDSCGLQSLTTFPATSGVHYKIRVGGYNAAVGTGTITLSCDGQAVCYANCDGTTIPPVLNVSDFICFQTKYAANDPYANCDNSTIPPILNVSDFICFQAKYAAGCS